MTWRKSLLPLLPGSWLFCDDTFIKSSIFFLTLASCFNILVLNHAVQAVTLHPDRKNNWSSHSGGLMDWLFLQGPQHSVWPRRNRKWHGSSSSSFWPTKEGWNPLALHFHTLLSCDCTCFFVGLSHWVHQRFLLKNSCLKCGFLLSPFTCSCSDVSLAVSIVVHTYNTHGRHGFCIMLEQFQLLKLKLAREPDGPSCPALTGREQVHKL